MRLPDFIIIGAMKSATSTLHDQLGARDGLSMSSPKELYFFSDDPVYANGIDWYADHFADVPASNLCGESTTHYTKLPTYPDTVRRIAQHVPDARFVYMMRHPIDRLESAYLHMWFEKETTLSFDEAVSGGIPELVDYGRYAYQLQPFFDQFGQDRVLPVFLDRMKVAQDEVIEQVCQFIGFTGDTSWIDNVADNNVSTERLQKSATRDRLKSVPFYESLRQLVPEQAIERVRSRWRPDDAPRASDAQRAELATQFDPDLAQLGTWLGTPLNCENFKEVTASRCLTWSTS